MVLVEVQLRRITAIIEVDLKNYNVIYCSNSMICKKMGINRCPPYCEIIVAAKDYVSGRRAPRAIVSEVKVMKEHLEKIVFFPNIE